MKVLFCPSDNNATSGAFLQMVDLIKELVRSYSITPLIVLPSKNGSGKDLLEAEGLPYVIVAQEDWVIPKEYPFSQKIKKLRKIFKKDIKAFFRLVKLIKKEQIDVVHLNTIWTFAGGLAALWCHKKLVWHIREALTLHLSSKIIFPFAFSLINRADTIVTISNAVAESYPKLDRQKISVIYDGIDEQKHINNKDIFGNDIIKLICIGEIYRQKGQEVLVDACSLLLKENIKNWHLDLVGDGAVNEIKKKITLLNLDPYISVLGPQKNVHQFLSQSDIGFTPSWYEGFGRTAAEIAMSGRLLICSDTGAFPEIYVHKKTALMHAVASAQSIAEAIKWAFSHPKESKRIAATGQKHVLKNFTIKENAKNIYTEYVKLFDERKNT